MHLQTFTAIIIITMEQKSALPTWKNIRDAVGGEHPLYPHFCFRGCDSGTGLSYPVSENTARQNRGQNASVQIYFDYSFDQETNLSLREWEKIHYQNEMRELIYSAAHRMGAAAFSEGASIFYIMSSRPVLMREFIQNGEYQKILFYGQQTPHNRLWIGIGYGDSPWKPSHVRRWRSTIPLQTVPARTILRRMSISLLRLKRRNRSITQPIFCTGFASAAVRTKN